jgi:hypothetical protein
MTLTVAIALCAPLAVAATGVGVKLLRRALARDELLPEEFALAGAWVSVVGAIVWWAAFMSDSSLLGFSEPWTWLAAAHFAVAGFGALTVTALACRTVSNLRALRVLRVLLVVHPIAYLITAAGISGVAYCSELGAASYVAIFVTQATSVVFGCPDRVATAPRRLFVVALVVPIWTLLPSLAWALGRPLFDLDGMVRYHGVVNAVGHVGLGLTAAAWGRPPAHSTLRGIGYLGARFPDAS